MDIRAMRYFVAIVDHGSLTRAAEVVCVAQPALSQQLAALEEEFGVPLVHRGAKGVRPTEAGKTLYRHIRNILRQVEIAGADVRVAGSEISGNVAIGLPTTAAAAFGMPLMRAVRQRYPQVRLQLFESMSGYISELLNQNRLDFAILFRDTASRAVEPEPLASEPLYLIGTPPGRTTRSATIALKALDGIPLVLPSGSQGLREVVERSFAKAGIALNVVADLDSLPFLLAAAREGLACTVLPASSLGESPGAEGDGAGDGDGDGDGKGDAEGGIGRRLILPELRRTLSLCWPRALPRSNAAEAVAEILREIVAVRIAQGGSLAPPPSPAAPAGR